MPWALPILPATAGMVLAVLRPRSAQWVIGTVWSVATLVVVLSAVALVCRPAAGMSFLLGSRFALGVDGLAGATLVTVAAVALLVLVFSIGELRIARRGARFGGLMLIFLAAVIATVTATTLPTLLMAWEIMGATSYALISTDWQIPGKNRAGIVAFGVTRAADLGLYVAAGAALAAGSGLELANLSTVTQPLRTVIAVGVAVAALGKAAQLPFSSWLSDAMQGPSPVSALLHSAAMVAMGGYLLLRVQPLLAAAGWVAPAVAWTGGLTALLLGAVALAQTDLKQLLAASTASQLGFVVLAAGVGGVSAGTTQLIAHAATKALLFLAAGAWLAAVGTKQLAALAGVARRWPLIVVLATVGLLSLAGIAPLSLWASKETVLAATIAGSGASSVALYGVGLAAAAMSAGYAGRALRAIWARPRDPASVARGFDTEQPGSRRIEPGMRPPLLVLASGAAKLGVLALPPVSTALAAQLGSGRPATPSVPELAGSVVLTTVVLILALHYPVPAPRWALGWLGLGVLVESGVVRPTLAVARALAWADSGLVDRAVAGSVRGVLIGAGAARRVEDFGVGRSVAGFAHMMRRLGRLARRPQTGLLHQYYLQSVVLLAAVVVLLLVAG